MPYGTPATALAGWLVHTIVLDRLGSARVAQAVNLTSLPSGASAGGFGGAGAGMAAKAGGYKVYGPESLDIAVGDTFVHDGRVGFDPATDDGILFQVEWVSTVAWGPMDGATMRVAYATAAHGVGTE